MVRPPIFNAETKTRIVLAVLGGEVSVAEAAREEKVSEQSVGRWKAEFLEGGKTALGCLGISDSGPSWTEGLTKREIGNHDLSTTPVRSRVQGD